MGGGNVGITQIGLPTTNFNPTVINGAIGV